MTSNRPHIETFGLVALDPSAVDRFAAATRPWKPLNHLVGAMSKFGGAKKAIGAVAASILTAIYHMLKTGAFYQDLGAVHFQRRSKPA